MNNNNLLQCESGHIFTDDEASVAEASFSNGRAGDNPVCPYCWSTEITDYEPDTDAVNTLIGNERDYIESRAVNVACVGLLMFVLTIFSLAVMLPDETSGRVSSGAVQGVIR